MKVCAMTGASGFIGKALVQHFQNAGWKVIALVRNTQQALANTETRQFQLGKPVPRDVLAGVDLLIHAAYDFSLSRWDDICRVNVVGSEYLFDAAHRAGVKRQIFISSLSAFEGCCSFYGRSKLTSEEALQVHGGGVIIRPGMVYGENNGGIAAKIAAFAEKLPVVPMIGHGNYHMYTCHIDDLCKLVGYMAGAKEYPQQPIAAANSSPITLRMMTAGGTKQPTIIPIPWQLLAYAFGVIERLGMRPPFRSDSVISFVHRNPSPDFSVGEQLPIQFRPYQAALRR